MSDVETANKFRATIHEQAKPLLDVMQAARVAGLVINFQIAQDSMGVFSLQNLTIVKPL